MNLLRLFIKILSYNNYSVPVHLGVKYQATLLMPGKGLVAGINATSSPDHHH